MSLAGPSRRLHTRHGDRGPGLYLDGVPSPSMAEPTSRPQVLSGSYDANTRYDLRGRRRRRPTKPPRTRALEKVRGGKFRHPEEKGVTIEISTKTHSKVDGTYHRRHICEIEWLVEGRLVGWLVVLEPYYGR